MVENRKRHRVLAAGFSLLLVAHLGFIAFVLGLAVTSESHQMFSPLLLSVCFAVAGLGSFFCTWNPLEYRGLPINASILYFCAAVLLNTSRPVPPLRLWTGSFISFLCLVLVASLLEKLDVEYGDKKLRRYVRGVVWAMIVSVTSAVASLAVFTQLENWTGVAYFLLAVIPCSMLVFGYGCFLLALGRAVSSAWKGQSPEDAGPARL